MFTLYLQCEFTPKKKNDKRYMLKIILVATLSMWKNTKKQSDNTHIYIKYGRVSNTVENDQASKFFQCGIFKAT